MKSTDFSVYLLVVLAIFVFLLTVFTWIGFVPSYVDGSYKESQVASVGDLDLSVYGFDNYRVVALADVPQLGDEEETESVLPPPLGIGAVETPAFPERVVINGIGLDLPILNPVSTSIEALDEALLEGTVRYPDSAQLGEDGNIFIFGHSSHLPVVHNQMYRAFNDLPDLETGDTITLKGGGKDHIYRVTEVRETDASEELVDLSRNNGRKLTLSTCNTFGAKSARWIVEAEFVASFDN